MIPMGGPVFGADITVAASSDERTASVTNLRWMIRDVTQRKLAETKLQRANAELQERTAQVRALDSAKFQLSLVGRTGDGSAKQALEESGNLIDEAVSTSRSLTAELSPPILHEAGLNAGLRWLVTRMADRQGLSVDLRTEEIGDITEELTILLFESIRELLFNVVRGHNSERAESVDSVAQCRQNRQLARIGSHIVETWMVLIS